MGAFRIVVPITVFGPIGPNTVIGRQKQSDARHGKSRRQRQQRRSVGNRLGIIGPRDCILVNAGECRSSVVDTATLQIE